MSQDVYPIQIHDMTIAYHKKPVLWDVDLDVPEGQLVGIIGPNGAGKSTMIKAIMDLVPKASGWVKIYGEDYSEMRKIIGYVPQRESVDWDFPISAFDFVDWGTPSGKCGAFVPSSCSAAGKARDFAKGCVGKSSCTLTFVA